MKKVHTWLFFISLFGCSNLLLGQATSVQTDSVSASNKYGLRVGIDLAKPIRSLVTSDYSGLEILGDFRVTEKWYAAAEVGTEKKDSFEENINVGTAGSYIKIGADYNAHNNWLGLNNAIFVGLRYGFSSFNHELLAYRIYTTTQVYPQTVRVEPQEFNGLTAQWAELQLGVKAEILNNLYLTLHVELKRTISESVPENFANLYIPGFNRTNDTSPYGAGYGYSISYLIPLFKK